MNHFQALHFQQVTSTNDVAFDLTRKGQASHYSIIVADSQTNGRGRKDRVWQSDEGNVFFSLVLQFPNACKVTDYSFITACVIGDVLKSFGIDAHYKWPNDIIIHNKKVAGILLQMEQINKVDHLVIGVGVNMVACPSYATCLKEVGCYISKDEFLQKFEEIFLVYETKYQQFGFVPIRNGWKEKAFKLGCTVTLSSGQSGVFEDVDEQGNLVLRGDDGQRFVSGVAEIL